MQLAQPHFDQMTGLELQKRFCNWVKFRAVPCKDSSRREICVSQASNDWDEFDFRSPQSMLKWRRFWKCWHKPVSMRWNQGHRLAFNIVWTFENQSNYTDAPRIRLQSEIACCSWSNVLVLKKFKGTIALWAAVLHMIEQHFRRPGFHLSYIIPFRLPPYCPIDKDKIIIIIIFESCHEREI